MKRKQNKAARLDKHIFTQTGRREYETIQNNQSYKSSTLWCVKILLD